MPQYDFDIVVIGGGAAGLSASGLAAALGAKTALVERARTGGDCTWTGCIPSKALLRAADVVHTIRTAGRYGLEQPEPVIDFARVMERVRATRRDVYEEADAPDVIRARNIDLIEGAATFVDPHTLAVRLDGETRLITARYYIICAGSSPVLPHVPGLTAELMLTGDMLFEIDELPERLVVLGGGRVGIEMAQAFRRFGSQVVVVEQAEEILSDDEPECARFLRESLEAEGIRFHLRSHLDSVAKDTQGYFAQISSGERWTSARCDRVLIATGRKANLEGLGLEAAGVAHGEHGITINHSAQTSASHIYACGDVAEGMHFTHVAEDMAKTAVTRLLLKVPSTFERRSVPWVTFTDPEAAHLGRTSAELKEAGTRFETIRFPYSKIDRALCDRTDQGFILLHIAPVTGKLYGAHIVGENAGEMINELALAMHHGLSLRDISGTLHAYPTYLLGVRRAADQWYVRQGSPRIVETVKHLFGYRGRASKAIGGEEVV
jgi:pyruvate/2-oxoglutarate dehydrogenase complex dihydrolipoamide dehydrogenase (E3) component